MALAENIAAEFNTVDQSGAVGAVRKQAFTAFEKLGIPSTRHEEWKYTNIKTKLPETLSLQANNEDLELATLRSMQYRLLSWYLSMECSIKTYPL